MRILLIIVITWLIISYFIDLNQYFLPNLIGVIRSIYTELNSGALLSNIMMTFSRVIWGISIGILFGMPIGFLFGFMPKIKKEVMPLIEFIRGIPTSMFFPIYIVAFGIGEISKTVIIATATFPIILINTVFGCVPRKETQDRRDYIAVHKDRLSKALVFFVTFWDALPSIIAGLKVSISISLVLAIVAEMFFVASSGVGWAAHQAYLSFNLELMYAYVLVVGLIGYLLNYTFDLLYNYFFNIMGFSDR